jgi:hypothetical protein
VSDVLPISSTSTNTCVLLLCRFLCPPWQNVALESKELMSACLRKIPGLSKVCHITVSVHTLMIWWGGHILVLYLMVLFILAVKTYRCSMDLDRTTFDAS